MSDYRKHLNKVSLKSKFLNRVKKKSGLAEQFYNKYRYFNSSYLFILTIDYYYTQHTHRKNGFTKQSENLTRGYLRFPEPMRKAIKDRGLKAFCIVSTMIVTVAISRTNYWMPISELSIEKKSQAVKFNELSAILFFEKHITCLINEANVRSTTEFIITGKIKHMQL
ncbi:hypothetical protein ALC60_00340 [Trachymyrmex zeteki]|uniref:Uncharacterized protein n=1 Tax=Mycetomoellerius zeteki TaxID=64791 RepID=A0A151XK85_9HYME|nr:hypothetical protein ALC60_00340 [Trachymyrmex zeteki]